MALSREEIIQRIEESSRRLPLERLVEVLDFVGFLVQREVTYREEPEQAAETGEGLIKSDGLLVFDARPVAVLDGVVDANRQERLETLHRMPKP